MARNKTPRRYDVLEAIRENERASIRELAEACGMKATSQVYYHLNQLEAEGVIYRTEGARNIHLGRKPKGYQRTKQSGGRKKSAKPATLKQQTASPLRGEGAFKPKKAHDADSLQDRIDAVVAKAQAGETGPNEDVIRINRGLVFRAGTKAHRIG